MEKKAIRKNPFPIHDNSDHYVNSNPESSHQYEHWNNTCNWYISIRRIWFDEKTVSFHVTDYPHACSGQSVEKGISTLCATHIVEKRVILSHWKKDSSNQVVSKFFSENVTFTKFLRKKWENLCNMPQCGKTRNSFSPNFFFREINYLVCNFFIKSVTFTNFSLFHTALWFAHCATYTQIFSSNQI